MKMESRKIINFSISSSSTTMPKPAPSGIPINPSCICNLFSESISLKILGVLSSSSITLSGLRDGGKCGSENAR
jgi:hypothetical protein